MSCSKKSLAALLGSINAPYTLFRHRVMIILILLTIATILIMTTIRTIITTISLIINYLSWAPKDWAGQSLEVIAGSIREGVEPAWWDLITDQEIGIIIRRLEEGGSETQIHDKGYIAHHSLCQVTPADMAGTLQCILLQILLVAHLILN